MFDKANGACSESSLGDCVALKLEVVDKIEVEEKLVDGNGVSVVDCKRASVNGVEGSSAILEEEFIAID